MVVASGRLILGWSLRWWQVDGGWGLVVTMGLLGLLWFVFFCDFGDLGWVVVAMAVAVAMGGDGW